jgi:hypothetical protein
MKDVNGDPSKLGELPQELDDNYQFTYSFEDVSERVLSNGDIEYTTKQISSKDIVVKLREKNYEDGWLSDHDSC